MAELTVHRQAKRCLRGFTIIEVTISMMVFLMMILVFAAVFPFAVRTAQFSNNYSQAALIAQHKIDQLHSAGYSRLNYNALSGLGIIDSSNSAPYSFAGVDHLVNGNGNSGFFGPGSTATITIQDYNLVNSAIPAGQMDYVTVIVRWVTPNMPAGTYKVSTLIRST
jgi:Tfp pilus assembly protein PilV